MAVQRVTVANPITNRENYSETDSRHTLASNQGWHLVDGNSGITDGHNLESTRDFPDGPGRWRQT